jgi:hypothetical protein
MSKTAGRVLYGSDQQLVFSILEQKYWEIVVGFKNGRPKGYKALRDPYGYIDGGYNPPSGGYLFCCCAQPWKGSALALLLMPTLRPVWHTTGIIEFADRWVGTGGWTQPDPCAPAQADMKNYGVTFGPDPKKPGDCIRDTDPSDGIGRFPQNHATMRDGGGRMSAFVNALWHRHRASFAQ